MTAYASWHAELYDLFYAEKPYEREAGFVSACLRELATRPAERLLELACGTGRHALALESLGHRVLATDTSPEMLAVARHRGLAAGSKVEFRQADMRSLDLSERPFDAALCLFDSLGYVQTNAAIEGVLAGVARHLAPGGLFVCEFWHAAAMLRGFEPVRVRRFATPRGEVLRISETSLDVPASLARVTYSIYDFDHAGSYRSLAETQTNRFFSVAEMGLFLSGAGLVPLRWFAGYSTSEQIDSGAWHVLAVARKD